MSTSMKKMALGTLLAVALGSMSVVGGAQAAPVSPSAIAVVGQDRSVVPVATKKQKIRRHVRRTVRKGIRRHHNRHHRHARWYGPRYAYGCVVKRVRVWKPALGAYVIHKRRICY